MLKNAAIRVGNIAPLGWDFSVCFAREWAFLPRWVLIVGGFLVSTSVLALAATTSTSQDNLMLWFQADGTLDFFKLIAERPWSFLTMVAVIAFAVRMTSLVTKFYARFLSEHNDLRIKMGLVPEHEMTEDQKKGVVLTAADLGSAIQEQKEWINKRFVSRFDYETNQKEIRKQLQEILNRGQRVRKSDNNGEESQ
jgi:hypothetical protein